MSPAEPEFITTTRPIIPPYSSHPTIVTSNPHVFLRPYQISDLEELFEMRSQIEVMKWTSRGTVDADLNGTRTFMSQYMEIGDETWNLTDWERPVKGENNSADSTKFSFAIVYLDSLPNQGATDTITQKVIGIAGCHILEPEPECGYMIRQEYWGKGITTAVMKAFLKAYWSLERVSVQVPWDAQKHTPDRIILEEDSSDTSAQNVLQIRETIGAVIDTANVSSRRVIEKCGFQFRTQEPFMHNGTKITLAHYTLARPC